jgi:2-dehydro-3-deoxyphosphooctonate aldolase (KDO 8-P synthase)|tara:strand:+ start:67 stop:858 length:792 start_codon:yes stop_codon:yes gene_type:complete
MRLVAGPCQHENLELSTEIAQECKDICDKYGVEYYFKASYDKANRTSMHSERGQGLKKTLFDLSKIKKDVGVPILTDVHDREQLRTIRAFFDHVVDVIQIPAFLCRQTDLIVDASRSGKIINIKKGQFLAPWDIDGVLSKTEGAKDVWITERGTSFGYNRLVVDFAGMVHMLQSLGNSLFYDATHSVQRPGGGGDKSSGDSVYVPSMLRAAAALGVESFFIEVHPYPSFSPSDGDNMLLLSKLDEVVEQILEFNYVHKSQTVV